MSNENIIEPKENGTKIAAQNIPVSRDGQRSRTIRVVGHADEALQVIEAIRIALNSEEDRPEAIQSFLIVVMGKLFNIKNELAQDL